MWSSADGSAISPDIDFSKRKCVKETPPWVTAPQIMHLTTYQLVAAASVRMFVSFKSKSETLGCAIVGSVDRETGYRLN